MTSQAEKPLTHQLVLLPAKEGMFMVTATVETEGEEGNVSRIFSIPVIVAAAGSRRDGPPPATAPAPAATNRCAKTGSRFTRPPGPGHIMQFGLRLHCYVKTGRGHPSQREL